MIDSESARSRRKFFTRAERSFMEDASRNVVLDAKLLEVEPTVVATSVQQVRTLRLRDSFSFHVAFRVCRALKLGGYGELDVGFRWISVAKVMVRLASIGFCCGELAEVQSKLFKMAPVLDFCGEWPAIHLQMKVFPLRCLIYGHEAASDGRFLPADS